jgi:hypothetical protein
MISRTSDTQTTDSPGDGIPTGDRIGLVLHAWHDEHQRCHRCGGRYDGGQSVHIVIGKETPPTDTAVCGPCVRKVAGAYGLALVHLRDGLEQVDTALATVPDESLHRLASLATEATRIMVEAYGNDERQRFVRLHAVPAGGAQ